MAAPVPAGGEAGSIVEVAHTEWVTLESAGPHQVLVHHGVGERCRAPFHADLAFHNGLAVLVPKGDQGGAQTVWANDILTKSLHLQEVAPGQQGLVVFDKELDKSIWRESLAGAHTVITYAAPTSPPFSCEMYFFRLAPCGGPGPRIFFSIRYFQNFLFGSAKHTRWISRNLDSWVRRLSELGVGAADTHFVGSSKAKASKARHGEEEVAASLGTSAAQEYGASALALVTMLVNWACTNRQVLPKQQTAAADVLRPLLAHVLRGVAFQVHFNAGSLHAVLIFNDGRCHLKRQDVDPMPKRSTPAWTALAELGQEMPVHDFVVRLQQLCLLRSQQRDVKACIKQALLEVARAFHNLVEDSDCEAWRTGSPLNLPVMRLKTGKRARRVSKYYKQAVAAATHSGSIVRQPNQLVAAMRIFKQHESMSSEPVSNTAAKLFVQDFMLSYLATSRKTFDKVRHCSISLDGLRVGGHEVLQLAFFDLDSELACWLPPQVLRDSKLRVTSPGMPFSKDEQEKWQRQVAVFFKRNVEEEKEALAKKRENFSQPRLSTLDWLNGVDNALRQGTNYGLERFANVSQHLSQGTVPPVLTIAMDQEQVQWTAIYFLMFAPGLQLCTVGIHDNYHRRHNDMMSALKSSGMLGQFLCKIPEYNLCYGPWQNSAWMNDFMDGAADVSQGLTADDPLLLQVWPGICKDLGYILPEQQDRAARAAFLQDLPGLPVFTGKGPKAATSRWMSWQGSFRFHDRFHHCKLLVAVYVSLKKGWVSSADEIWSTDNFLSTQGEAADAAQEAGEAIPAPAASSLSGEPPAKKPRITRPLEALKSTQKGAFKNTFLAVTKAMANPDLLHGARVIAHLTAGLALEHGLTAQTMRGAKKSRDLFINWSLYSWMEPLTKMIDTLADPSLLDAMGLSVEFNGRQFANISVNSPIVVCEDIHAATVLRLATELMKARCTSMSWHTSSYPGLLAPLLSTDHRIVEQHMQLLKEHATAYEAAKQINRPEVTRMVNRSCMRGKFMEAVVFFARRAEWRLSPEVQELVAAAFKGLHQTKLNEDANQQVRDYETRNAAHKTSRNFAVWHVPVGNNLLGKYQFQEMQADPSLPSPQPSTTLFRRTCQDREIRADQQRVHGRLPLQEVLQGGDWWSPNAQSQTRGYAELQLLRLIHKTGNWDMADQSWRCSLLPVGQWVVAKSDRKRIHFVVANLGCGALVWPDVRLDNDKKHFMFDPSVKRLEWVHLFDFSEYSVVLSKVASPLHRRVAKGTSASLCVSFVPQVLGEDNFKGLLEWHASKGFAGVPEAIMRKLHCDLGLPDRDTLALVLEPKNECEIVLEVMHHVNPDLTEADARQLLCQRVDTDCADIAFGEMDCEMLRDVVLPKDHDDIINLAKAQAEAKRKRQAFSKHLPKVVELHFKKHPQTQAAKAKAKKAWQEGGGAVGLTKSQVQRHFAAGNYLTVLERLMPPLAKVIEDKSNGRYLVALPSVGRRSFSWTRRGQRECAALALKTLWTYHQQHGGDPPPFDIERLMA